MMAEQLRPCPFCGAEAVHSHVIPPPGERFGCSECSIQGYNAEDWQRRTPGPATQAMLVLAREWAQDNRLYGERLLISQDQLGQLQAFLAEWPDPATPPMPAPPPWRCRICGEPVRLGDDLRLRHIDSSIDHEAELTDADLKQLNDGLGLTD